MAEMFKQKNLSERGKVYLEEIEIRELIAQSLANWAGVTRFQAVEVNSLTLSDFTDANHDHSSVSEGGQITDSALSGAVSVSKGGTGKTSVTSGVYLKGNGTGALTEQTTPIPVADGGSGAATLTGIVKGNGTSAFTTVTPLAGTKVYYVADSSGGPVTRKLTFTDGILTAET